MSTIKYKIQGTYVPFSVELREGSKTGPVVDSMVVQSADTEYSFTGITGSGEYFVVAFDSLFGVDGDDTEITTTTTTTTSTSTSTTTLPPTTTTTTTTSTSTSTTTLPPTTTTTTSTSTSTTTLPPTTTTTTSTSTSTSTSTTSTSTTTEPPNPLIFLSYRNLAVGPACTNTNSQVVSGDALDFIWTTDSNNTQSPSLSGPALTKDAVVSFNWQPGGPVCFDHSTTCCVTNGPAGNDFSGNYNVTLSSGDKSGYVKFFVCNTSGGFVQSPFTLTASNSPDTSQCIGEDSDSADPLYKTAAAMSCTYGYTQLVSTINLACLVVAP